MVKASPVKQGKIDAIRYNRRPNPGDLQGYDTIIKEYVPNILEQWACTEGVINTQSFTLTFLPQAYTGICIVYTLQW